MHKCLRYGVLRFARGSQGSCLANSRTAAALLVAWELLLNLHEGSSGLDRPDANGIEVEELNRLVKEEFGDGSQTI